VPKYPHRYPHPQAFSLSRYIGGLNRSPVRPLHGRTLPFSGKIWAERSLSGFGGQTTESCLSVSDPIADTGVLRHIAPGGNYMSNPWARDRATFFYLAFGLGGLAVVTLGFGVTYALPMVRRTFAAPWFVHLHGAAALAWIVLIIAQSVLVRAQRTPLHRELGQGALLLAVLVWWSGIATALWAAQRDFGEQGSAATSSLAGTVSGLSLYLILVITALLFRRRADWHKRLMMLATIQLLWPAFFRLLHLFPAVPYPDISFALVMAYSPILVAAVRDQLRYGKIHPVWLIVGPALVIEQCLEFAFFDRGPLKHFGWLLYHHSI